MQDTAKPVTDLDFPSVTICSSGLNMEAVRQALFNDFANWRINNQETDNQHEALNVYMEEKYAMKVGEGNIFDTIKGMNSPPMGDTENEKGNTASVVSSLASCAKKNESHNIREKRSVEGKRFINFHSFFPCYRSSYIFFNCSCNNNRNSSNNSHTNNINDGRISIPNHIEHIQQWNCKRSSAILSWPV